MRGPIKVTRRVEPEDNTNSTASAPAAGATDAGGPIDDLIDQAGAIDNPPLPPGEEGEGGSPPVPLLTNAEILRGALEGGREAICTLLDLKSPADVLTADKIRAMADGWGAWCDRRNISLSDKMGEHADTIPLAIATGTLALALYKGMKAEIDVKVAARGKPPAVAPGAIPPPPPPPPAAAANGAAFTPGVIKPAF